MLSHYFAKCKWWVFKITVFLLSLFLIAFLNNCSPTWASTADNGSSSKNISDYEYKALARDSLAL